MSRWLGERWGRAPWVPAVAPGARQYGSGRGPGDEPGQRCCRTGRARGVAAAGRVAPWSGLLAGGRAIESIGLRLAA